MVPENNTGAAGYALIMTFSLAKVIVCVLRVAYVKHGPYVVCDRLHVLMEYDVKFSPVGQL